MRKRPALVHERLIERFVSIIYVSDLNSSANYIGVVAIGMETFWICGVPLTGMIFFFVYFTATTTKYRGCARDEIIWVGISPPSLDLAPHHRSHSFLETPHLLASINLAFKKL